MLLVQDLWHQVAGKELNSSVVILVGAVVASILYSSLAALKTSTLVQAPNNAVKFLVRRVYAWLYLFYGPGLIQDGYDSSKGKPFELHAPDGRYVFVTSPEQIQELNSAPDTVLSLQAASKQMLQPKYTMHGFSWFDTRGTEGVGFVRALRTLLTNNLPQILPDISTTINTRFAELRSGHKTVNDAIHSPVYPMIVKLTVLTNALAFFGKDLAKDEAFMVSALAYIEDTLMCAELVRLLPGFVVPLVGKIMSDRLTSQRRIFDTLLPVAEQRVRERELQLLGQKVPQHADCISWIIETAPKQNPWTGKRVVHELMAIWFGSVHAVSTTVTFAVHDLCLHPSYVAPIRAELESAQYKAFEQSGVGLPLLDSFIKESARLTPVESMSTRRHALKPFTLADGTKLHPGDWACTPVKAMMQSATHYPSPLDFQGFRFVDPRVLSAVEGEVRQPEPSKLTDPGNTFHVWGTGRMVCPGRFYAAAIMKVIVGQIVMGYDFELVEPEAKRWFTWRSSMLPLHGTMIKFTPR